MTNGDKIRQMSDEELMKLIIDEPWCDIECPNGDVSCDTCLYAFLKASDKEEALAILESKRDGFFECNMTYCRCNLYGKCTNPCYLDCPYYSLRQSLRELMRKYEEIVTKL